MHRLKAADEDGLDPTDYRVPDVAARAAPRRRIGPRPRSGSAPPRSATPATRAARASSRRGSRGLVTPTLALPGAEEVLAALRRGRRRRRGARILQPAPCRLPGAQGTPRAAARRAARPSRWCSVPQGRALRVGMRDPRVPLIRARFNLGPPDDRDNAYDERVASAVADFQNEKGLPANGVLTPQTVAALSGSSSGAARRRPHRQHGALALAAGRSRRAPYRRERPGVPPAHRRERRRDPPDPGDRRQGRNRRRRSSPTRWRP